MLRIYHQRLDAADIGSYMCFGHIGDAHVHINVLPETAEQAATGSALLMDLAKEVIALGGTISAEHGLGKQKAPLLKLQYSPEHIEAMMAVKQPSGPAVAARPRHFVFLPPAIASGIGAELHEFRVGCDLFGGLGREFRHLRVDVHGAELRPAHGAEVRHP